MKNIVNGAIYMLTAVSIALNIAQYRGVLTSPQVVQLEQTDQQKLAEIYGGV